MYGPSMSRYPSRTIDRRWYLLLAIMVLAVSADQQQVKSLGEKRNRTKHTRGPEQQANFHALHQHHHQQQQKPNWQTTHNRRVEKHEFKQAPVQRGPARDHRLLSLFTLVRFDNNVCVGLTGENGTCISPAECAQRGGLSSGVCANGYGVCCIVTVTCGQSTFDNNTYFVNPNYPSTFDGTDSCQLTIIKSHPDVCQFRLDFVQFNIRGPETVNNLCTYDQFIVSGGTPVSPICGNNNGNHMYVDVGTGPTNPVTLSFVTSGSGFERSWRVRIAQIPCSTIFRAEEGCLQYFTGVSGQIKSFNYEPNVGLQLSNQDYSICIRMERNFCGIQYMACDDVGSSATLVNPVLLLQQQQQQQSVRSNSFSLSGNTLTGQAVAMTDRACQNDWLLIPCSANAGRLPGSQVPCVDRFCGGAFNTDASLNSTSIISTVKPFRLYFHTDGTEAPNDYGNRGFCLNYIQQPCTMKLR